MIDVFKNKTQREKKSTDIMKIGIEEIIGLTNEQGRDLQIIGMYNCGNIHYDMF